MWRNGTLLFFALLVIFGGVMFATQRSVDEAVRRESIDKAEHYASYMASRIPDLEGLIASARPTQEQITVIREVRQLGDVFRFKLFDSTGRLVLLSDDESLTMPNGVATEVDPEPALVGQNRQPIADVYDGSEKPDRPDFYSEAYIPLIDAEDQLFGVAEVYINQTKTRAYFHDSFRMFGLAIAALSALLFGAPYVRYRIQRSLTEKTQKDAEFLASYDPLTGLMNRREFVEHAHRMLEENSMSAVCFIDVDRFKSVNDVHGHAAGDRYLSRIAEILRSHTGAEDLASRFGGDEFVICFKDLDPEGVASRIRAILTECAAGFRHKNADIAGSVSVGIVVCEEQLSLDSFLSKADAALYHAKSNGKNTFSVYGDEMGEEFRKRNELETRIREATKCKDFSIQYQPLVEGHSKEVVGFEALLRLKSDAGENIPPSTFIPVAEELGLITEIGTWVIHTAVRDVAQLSDKYLVAVNLSAAQFRDGNLPEIVRDALREGGLGPERLELEITESLLLEDDPKVEFQIDALKEMGVSIAMDDFGTGFSSLSYLWKFGFDRLKIDRSFIAALETDSARAAEIIETIVVLGERLGMRTTAEGIETLQQSEFLSKLGCDILQGYLFGRPSDLSDVSALEPYSARPGSGMGALPSSG